MTVPILGLTAGYVALAVLLLSLNFTSRWRWWIKAGAITVTAGFFAVTYQSVQSLLGWPAGQRVPHQFQLHWATVVEPDKFLGDGGAIFLWVEELDAMNMPTGVPRAHKLPYSKELADKVTKAKEAIEAGRDQSGTAEDLEAVQGSEQDTTEKAGSQASQNEAGGSPGDPDALRGREMSINFSDLPPPVLEKKPGL